MAASPFGNKTMTTTLSHPLKIKQSKKKTIKKVIKGTLLFLIFFISATSFAQKNKKAFKKYIYKDLKVELFFYNNIKKSSQTKYSVNIENKDSFPLVKTLMLRYVEKPDSTLNFDYILFFEHNKNSKYNKMLPKYKYKEPLDTAQLVKQVNSLIDHNFLFDTVIKFNTAKMKEAVMTASKNNIKYLCDQNFTEFSKSIYPFSLKELNYPQRAARYEELFSAAHYKYISGFATLKSEVVNYNGALQCLVTWDLDVVADSRKEKNKMNMIATSLDEGVHWYFTDVMAKDIQTYEKVGFNYSDVTLEKSLVPILKSIAK